MPRLSLQLKIMLPVTLLVLVTVAFVVWSMQQTAHEQIVSQHVESATSTIQQFKALREYYTDAVVRKVKQSGTVGIGYDHSSSDQTIPLPATMIHDLSEKLSQSQGTQLKLYSQYPFPHRASRQLDAFEEASLAAFATNPDEVFQRVEVLNGQTVVRVAIADRLSAEACVACHNSHPASPKKDWKLGEVRGVLEVISPIDRQLAAHQQAASNTIWVSLGVLAGTLLVTSLLIGWFVTRPLSSAAATLSQSASTTESVASGVADASQTLASAASQQASATEQSAASLQEVSAMTRANADHAAQASTTAREAIQCAEQGQQAMDRVEQVMSDIKASAAKSANIIATIDEIAFQTNLLALNAAVEAARAGDAGKGFAVVAQEVRALASRSAQAARETAQQIREVCTVSENGVSTVNHARTNLSGMEHAVRKLQESVQHMHVACDQQAMAVEQISQAVEQVQSGTQTVASESHSFVERSEQLSNQAELINRTTAELYTLIYGRANASGSAPATLSA